MYYMISWQKIILGYLLIFSGKILNLVQSVPDKGGRSESLRLSRIIRGRDERTPVIQSQSKHILQDL
jgi:hypothetical protein